MMAHRTHGTGASNLRGHNQYIFSSLGCRPPTPVDILSNDDHSRYSPRSSVPRGKAPALGRAKSRFNVRQPKRFGGFEVEKIVLNQRTEILNHFLPEPIGSPLVRVLFTKGMIAADFLGDPTGTIAQAASRLRERLEVPARTRPTGVTLILSKDRTHAGGRGRWRVLNLSLSLRERELV
jgi:hypothetical protein